MKRCPKCNKWTLEFDNYFGRFRCFNPDCNWMPKSSTERKIRLLESHQEPKPITVEKIPELGLTAAVVYDELNDVLGFDFRHGEATFDLPEPDGRIVWKVAHTTGDVVGFDILDAKKLGVSEVHVNIAARKEGIERDIKRFPSAYLSGKVGRILITSVAFKTDPGESHSQTCLAFRDAIEKFEAAYL